MHRRDASRSDDALSVRTLWLIPPQVGRLVPLAHSAAAREMDATLHAVATEGSSRRQIDEGPLGEGVKVLNLTAVQTGGS